MPELALAGGGQLTWTETGAGPALLLVHGSPGEGRSWARVAPRLPDGSAS